MFLSHHRRWHSRWRILDCYPIEQKSQRAGALKNIVAVGINVAQVFIRDRRNTCARVGGEVGSDPTPPAVVDAVDAPVVHVPLWDSVGTE